jgi:hypothetical protein
MHELLDRVARGEHKMEYARVYPTRPLAFGAQYVREDAVCGPRAAGMVTGVGGDSEMPLATGGARLDNPEASAIDSCTAYLCACTVTATSPHCAAGQQ